MIQIRRGAEKRRWRIPRSGGRSGAQDEVLIPGQRRRDPVGQDGIILQIRDLDHRHDAVLAVVHQKVRLRGVLERQNLDGALVDVVVGDARLVAEAARSEEALVEEEGLHGRFRQRADARIRRQLDGASDHDARDFKRYKLVDVRDPVRDDGDLLAGQMGNHPVCSARRIEEDHVSVLHIGCRLPGDDLLLLPVEVHLRRDVQLRRLLRQANAAAVQQMDFPLALQLEEVAAECGDGDAEIFLLPL